ncbi:hypothetical protein KXD40_008656 [Peronospora effusa]|nr:hypothetical protein KXD40_008656 [Peronospora effusa]
MKVTMSNAARISCALVFVTLAICSATSVADPKSTSAGVALTMMHSSHSPAAINRHLRRTTAMETTEAFEERAPTLHFSELSPSFSSLKSITTAIYQKIQSWVWRMTRKSSDDVFKLLNARQRRNKPVWRPTFYEVGHFCQVKILGRSHSGD